MPYFAVSFHRRLIETKQIIESDSKIELVRRQVRLLQVHLQSMTACKINHSTILFQEGRPPFALHVRRKYVGLDTLQAFSNMEAGALLQPMKVRAHNKWNTQHPMG